MLLVEALSIAPDDSTATLHDRLAALGGRMIVDALHAAARGPLVRSAQPVEGVNYAHKIEKADAPIDWRHSATVIERRIRAFDPFPGASAVFGGDTLKCWRASHAAGHGVPGEVLSVADDGITIACGQGALRLTELQRAGGKRLPARAFLQGTPVAVGQRFETRVD
jgi:methionyl-tRNA formyltransferase